MKKLWTTWFVFWEGALIAHFFGLWASAWWCLAWLVLALGVRIGMRLARK